MINNLKCVLEEFSERGLIFSHLSHVYKDGASIYTTFLFPHGKSHAETLQRWQQLKLAASRAVIANHGTISHQHGVGLDHMPYLEAEKGSIGIGAIKAVNKFLDPNGIFNPGKLVPIPD
jgi:alkyldihydroxyacetonephosphate synthase